MVTQLQRAGEPKAQPRVGLDSSTGGLHRRATEPAAQCSHPLLSAPTTPSAPRPLKHNLDRIQEASLKVVFPTPKLSNANFLFFFYWHDAIPLPTTQISEVLSHQAKAGTVGGAPQQGSKVWGARGFLPGPSALGPAPQTPGSGLLRPRTASSWPHHVPGSRGGKVTADGSAGFQLRQGPARSWGRSSCGTSGDRGGPCQVTTAFSIRPVPPRGLPAASAGIGDCSNCREQSAGIWWPRAKCAAQHPQSPGQSPPVSRIWAPRPREPERTHTLRWCTRMAQHR